MLGASVSDVGSVVRSLGIRGGMLGASRSLWKWSGDG